MRIIRSRLLCTVVAFREVSSSTSSRLAKMPKQVDNSDLRNMRLNKQFKIKNQNIPASHIALQVLGNGANGNPKNVYLFTDQQRYLFNCGEGTQRLAHEHKMKLARLDHIFITSGTWDNIGGLPGLILTIQDIGVPKITLHGPPDIEKLFSMTKRFMLTQNIQIVQRNIEEGTFEDSVLKVEYVTLESRTSCSNEDIEEEIISDDDDNINYYSLNSQMKNVRTNDSEPKKKRILKKSRQSFISVAYICKPIKKPGHLNLEKCVDFGVPPGPLLGELKNGKDITLPNGTVVKAADVISPEEPSPIFIVLECPTVKFLDSLLEAEAFSKHQMTAKLEEDKANIVVHLTPAEVIKHPKYQEWINRFSPITKHLFINGECNSTSSVAVHRLQHKLHLLHDDIYPLLAEEINEYSTDNCTDSTSVVGEPLIKYHLRPLNGFDREMCLKIEPEVYIEECKVDPNFESSLSDLKLKLADKEKELNCNNKESYPEILFLGTGSSIPSKVRNTSGILLNIRKDCNFIMDCGEGTYSQIRKFYGDSKTEELLSSLCAIFVSHLHADHHIGLIQLLQERRKALLKICGKSSPVILIAPHQIMYYLKSYHYELEPILDEFRLVPNVGLHHIDRTYDDSDYTELLKTLEMKQLSCVPVKHCKHAFGLVLHHPDFKLVYSGDTMPCDELIQAGKDCSVLIHEATMEDDLSDEAKIKRHSTTSEAIEVGQKMKAKFTILTHFSQRYAKVPLLNENFGSNVGIAFDNMKVSLKNLWCLPFFNSTLKLMFSEHYENMQEKTAKKIKRREKLQEYEKSTISKLQQFEKSVASKS